MFLDQISYLSLLLLLGMIFCLEFQFFSLWNTELDDLQLKISDNKIRFYLIIVTEWLWYLFDTFTIIVRYTIMLPILCQSNAHTGLSTPPPPPPTRKTYFFVISTFLEYAPNLNFTLTRISSNIRHQTFIATLHKIHQNTIIWKLILLLFFLLAV